METPQPEHIAKHTAEPSSRNTTERRIVPGEATEFNLLLSGSATVIMLLEFC
jgi:hypothetical protein